MNCVRAGSVQLVMVCWFIGFVYTRILAWTSEGFLSFYLRTCLGQECSGFKTADSRLNIHGHHEHVRGDPEELACGSKGCTRSPNEGDRNRNHDRSAVLDVFVA